jgi:hypothetical protein
MLRISATLISALQLCWWTLSVSAATIYGTAGTFGAQGPATLYKIDSTTGAASPVGVTGFDRVGAIDFNPLNGILYGIGADPVSGSFNLIRINTATGLATAVGPLGVDIRPGAMSDMSFRSDGTLYAIDGLNSVYTVNTSTGAATLLGGVSSFPSGNALAFSLTDTLYKVDIEAAYIVNQTNGSGTFVTSMNYPNATDRANGMDFDPATGVLFASVRHGPFGPGFVDHGPADMPFNYLATIDLTTGNVTTVGQTVDSLDALAVQPAVPSVPDSTSTLWLAIPAVILLCANQRRRTNVA